MDFSSLTIDNNSGTEYKPKYQIPQRLLSQKTTETPVQKKDGTGGGRGRFAGLTMEQPQPQQEPVAITETTPEMDSIMAGMEMEKSTESAFDKSVIGKMTHGAGEAIEKGVGGVSDFISGSYGAISDTIKKDVTQPARGVFPLLSGDMETIQGLADEATQTEKSLADNKDKLQKGLLSAVESPFDLAGAAIAPTIEALLPEFANDALGEAMSKLDGFNEFVSQGITKGINGVTLDEMSDGELENTARGIKDFLPLIETFGISKVLGKLKSIKKAVKSKPLTTEIKPIKTKPVMTRDELAVGMTEKIKTRLQNNPDLFEKYLNDVRINNKSDKVVSGLASAGKEVTKTMKKLDEIISAKGGEIGNFREKISKTRVSPVIIQDGMLEPLDAQLKRFGLGVGKNRQIKPLKGREVTITPLEVKKLQEYRDVIVRLKGDPSIGRLIDVRDKITRDIKFNKSKQATSGALDGVSRTLRGNARKINEGVLGKAEALKMDEYSQMKDLIKDYNRATSNGRNMEFLLKRLQSERDALPKSIINRIEELTGDDLMDHAVMSRIATELLGDETQKGLLQREIANAGISVVNMLGDGRIGTVAKGVKFLKDEYNMRKGIDPRMLEKEARAKTFLEAAKKRTKNTNTLQK